MGAVPSERACECCAASVHRGFDGGAYDMTCVRCCARLVRSARPLRPAQEALFAVVCRQPGRPSKEAVLAEIKRLDLEVLHGAN